MGDDAQRSWKNKCLPQHGPQNIIMRQVIGECSKQKSIDVHMCVPRRKPGIRQIIDVFVKKVCIRSVEIITDRVIVRGHFEVKAIYVACLPMQPVHAVELHRVRFSVAVPIHGARCGMDAEADVLVEYVDYDCVDKWRLYKNHEDDDRHTWHKPLYHHDCDDDCDDHCGHHHGKHYHHDCDDHCDDHCGHHHGKHHHHDCDDHCDDHCGHHHGKHHHHDCDDHCDDHCGHHHGKHHHCCTHEFDVAIVLRITAKVMADRPVIINQHYPMPGLPLKPKG